MTSQTSLNIQEVEKFFDLSHDMLCIANAEGYFKKINLAFTKTLGFTEEELMQKPFMEFIHPDDVDRTFTEVDRLSKGIKTIHFENRYHTKGGNYRWLSWSCQPDIETGLLYGIARDITAQKQAEAEILDTKQMVVEAVNALKCGIVIANEKGEFILFNEAAADLIGRGLVSAQPEQWADIYGVYHYKTDKKMTMEELPLLRALKGETITGYNMTVRNQMKPVGTDLSCIAKPLHDKSGGIIGGVLFLSEIAA